MIDIHKEALYRLCFYLEKDKDRADDLFQDTWVKALGKLHTYDETRAFYPWIAQIAVNLYRDKLRRLKQELKKRYYEETQLQNLVTKEESIENLLIHKEELRRVLEAIQNLQDKYKLPLLLVLYEKFSYKEVGQMLGISEKLVKSRVYDGRQKLRKLVGKEI